MAGVREDQRHLITTGPSSGRRSTGALVAALAVALAAIAITWNVSRRATHTPSLAIATVEAIEPAETPAAPGTVPEAAPATTAVAPADEPVASARDQAEIARVISAGHPALTACYERALVRDATLTSAHMTVRLSIGPSGKVGAVHVAGPAAYHAIRPCLERAISNWRFPTAPEAYVAEFPLALRGKQ